ncbi:MAG: hypothetical protein NVSMB64_12900 [Candidatus Velthaea sp.]
MRYAGGMKRLTSLAAVLGLILGMFAGARMAHASEQMPAMTGGSMMHHMALTQTRPVQPGDRERADAIVSEARAAMKQRPDVRAAEAAGFTKFAPGIELPIEHYTNYAYAREAWNGHFNPDHPTSMIFERHGDALSLIGVMYTAAAGIPEQQLDTMVPLSVARWHRHVDFCLPPPGVRGDARFGLGGSIDSRAECAAAHGRWQPQLFGWMVHVWPLEHDTNAIWAVDHHDVNGHSAMAM